MPIDYNKYPPNWKSEIRPRILDRAKNRCEFCGILNKKIVFRGYITIPYNKKKREVYQDIDGRVFDAKDSLLLFKDICADIEPYNAKEDSQAIKIVLTIAHLDHDEENWDVKDNRLAALCQKCHINYDKEEKSKRRSEKKYKSSLFPFQK